MFAWSVQVRPSLFYIFSFFPLPRYFATFAYDVTLIDPALAGYHRVEESSITAAETRERAQRFELVSSPSHSDSIAVPHCSYTSQSLLSCELGSLLKRLSAKANSSLQSRTVRTTCFLTFVDTLLSLSLTPSFVKELRTPLNGVSGYLEILQHSRPTEEQRQSIENATVCCEHLLRTRNYVVLCSLRLICYAQVL